VFLDASDFVWRALAMLPGLIDDCSGQKFRRIEFAHCEALEPCLLTACEAAKLYAPDVPHLDVDTVRAAIDRRERRAPAESSDNGEENPKPASNHPKSKQYRVWGNPPPNTRRMFLLTS